MNKLDSKLRSQAVRLGLVPGTPPWVRYVLGTQARERKRKQARKLSPKFRPPP
jgi:hypothetical protein